MLLPTATIAVIAGLAAARHATWSAPPRYDGAGYAVLARAILEGEGYRAIDHPDRPRHAHFPPGYPLVLAAAWRIGGVSVMAARSVSLACTIGATLAAWLWFRGMMPARAAFLLSIALAINWQWARTGGAIQSEPLYMLLGQLAILAASRGAGPIVLGVLLAACFLTRQIAVGLSIAILIHLTLQRGRRPALLSAATAALLVSPWLIWQASVGQTQAALAVAGGDSWSDRLVSQLAFYLRRLPDQITGPFVEVATTLAGRSWKLDLAVGLWVGLSAGVVGFGWKRALARPQRRLAALVPLSTLLVLLVWPFTEAGRFLIPMIPCILVGGIEGLAGSRWVVRCLRGWGVRRRTIAALIVLAVTLPYSSYSLIRARARAAEADQRDYDAACAYVASRVDRPGPVLSRHPGEVFWMTGRTGLAVASTERPGDRDADPLAIARMMDRYRVVFLLIDRQRYQNAPASPLARFVDRFPDRVKKVWSREVERSSVEVYEVRVR